jgi:sugar/nucleoside kinase (ribokinase family)
MSLLVTGTLAYDSVETAHDRRVDLLGGSAVHFGMAATNFVDVALVAVVGRDFAARDLEFLRARGMDTAGVETLEGKTFRWSGRYEADWNTRHTLDTQLNVLAHFDPKVPPSARDARYVFLANASPQAQLKALRQCPKRRFSVADTMNFWIESAREDLGRLLREVDGLVLNDEEARLLTGERNLIRAAHKVRELGPRYVLLKKGEHGAFLIGEDVQFALPAYPVTEVVDPTGAGDSFAGGFMGYLAAADSVQPRTLRRAMVYGTATASYCVEGFGVEGLAPHRRGDIESRFNELLDITTL